jgi:hypothetical protein
MRPATHSPRVRLVFAVLTLLLLGLSVPSWPLDDPYDRAALKGVTAIRLVVEYSNEDPERVSLNRDQLQTDAEGRLRKAGIRVISSPEESGGSFLFLKVETQKAPDGLYAYHIQLEFSQWVILARNRNVGLLAPTWSVSELGTVDAQRLSEVRDGAADELDKFINAFLEKNPN